MPDSYHPFDGGNPSVASGLGFRARVQTRAKGSPVVQDVFHQELFQSWVFFRLCFQRP